MCVNVEPVHSFQCEKQFELNFGSPELFVSQKNAKWIRSEGRN